MDRLPQSGASILSVCAGGWGMAQREGAYDFSAFDRQLAYAQEHNLRLALISEINPVYTPAWLKQRAEADGEMVCNASGTKGAIPSISSAVFQSAQEELVRRFVEHVCRTDTGRNVAYYHPGAEWWFPLGERYHPADVARFRQWLRSRYSTISELNEAWRSSNTDFAQISPPPIDMIGGGKGWRGLANVVSLEFGAQHCSWSTPAAMDPSADPGASTFAAVEPGKSYQLTAWVRTEETTGPGPFLEVAWIGPRGGNPIAIDAGRPAPHGETWTELSETFTAPKDAGRAWILLKFMGTGRVWWDDVRLRQAGSDDNLAPNPAIEGAAQPAGWHFQNWSGGKQVRARYAEAEGRLGSGCLAVEVPPLDRADVAAESLDAATYDWSLFWYETAADYINSLARLIKRYDPTRPTITYLTMSWAFPAEWDETQRSAIAPDEVAMRGHDIDGFGMQLCAADGDPYRITACLDLIRKYQKPLWTVDLVDFTSGVHIGYPAMDRITQSAVQHGSSGIIYCAWHIPTVLDYSFYPHLALEDTRAMLTDAGRAVRIMAGMKVHARGAILQPILPATPSDPNGFKNDFRSFMGWYKLLESLHQTFDVVTLRELDQDRAELSDYSYILMPDCAYLPNGALDALEKYRTMGGLLIAGGRFAQGDAIGRPLAREVSPSVTIPDHGKAYAGDPIRDTHAGNTPPLFLWRGETPETSRAFSEGRAALGRSLEAASDESIGRLLPDDTSIRCVEWSGGDSWAFYLVNMGDQPVPAGRLKLQLKHDALQTEIYADTRPVAGRALPGSLLELPAFRTNCIVKLTVDSH